MAPVRLYGVDFPPPICVNREDKNVYLRIYNGNSRIACGSFVADARYVFLISIVVSVPEQRQRRREVLLRVREDSSVQAPAARDVGE